MNTSDNHFYREPAAMSTERDLGRLGMRTATRQLLCAIENLSEAEFRAAGWSKDELDTLERIAGWTIDGVPFGDWITMAPRSAR